MHGRLASYIDEQVSRATKTGEPIMKPLFFNYPSDQSTYTIADEWLLGDSLLAAPVLADGTTRDVHVPAGQWFDVLNHKVINGPTTLHSYAADLSQTPAFIRLGSPDTGTLMKAFA
jgi:alpha-glucosidase (family GH31 glycosyl hydrolase)